MSPPMQRQRKVTGGVQVPAGVEPQVRRVLEEIGQKLREMERRLPVEDLSEPAAQVQEVVTRVTADGKVYARRLTFRAGEPVQASSEYLKGTIKGTGAADVTNVSITNEGGGGTVTNTYYLFGGVDATF